MTLTIILIVIIVILILAFILNQRYMQDRVDTEVYARNQMVTKNATLSNENLELKIKCLVLIMMLVHMQSATQNTRFN